ncbi:hypothetical protein ACQKDD_18200, partial [Planococcus kocurii]|uniref:hypothetical protein n=1 Tax=Planococcus kocurii TaxID=1374 RepID=UPI003D066BBE
FPLTIMLGFIFLQKWLSFQLLWWLSFKLPYTGASTQSAQQDYLYALDDSDVCLFLIDNADGVTPAIVNEITRAKSHPKKSLYLFCNENQKKATQIQEELKGAKGSKYYVVENFHDFIKHGSQDLINDISKIYINYCRNRLVDVEFESYENDNSKEIPILSDSLKKLNLKGMDKSKLYIGNLIYPLNQEVKESTEIDYYLEQFLKVLWGEKEIREFNTGLFFEILKTQQNNKLHEVVKLRWRAIEYYWLSDLNMATEFLIKALQLSKENKLPEWFVQDILIDLRNIEIQKGRLKNQLVIETEAQKELNEMPQELFHPVIDRYEKQLYEKINKQHRKDAVKSIYSVTLGNNLSSYVESLTNIFVAACYNGSLTHILLLKNRIKDIAFQLCEEYVEWEFKVLLMKMSFLTDDSKQIGQYFNYYNNILGKINSKDAKEIYEFTKCIPIKIERLKSQLEVFKYLGYFFNESDYNLVKDELLQDILEWIERENKEVFLGDLIISAVQENRFRMDSNIIVKICLEILNKKLYRFYDKIFVLVESLDLSNVREEELKLFRKALLECTLNKEIVNQSNNLINAVIAYAKQQIESVNEFNEAVQNNMSKADRELYFLELTNSNDYIYIHTYIESIEKKVDEEGKNGVYSFSGQNPYLIIKNILELNPQIADENIIHNLIQVCIKSLFADNLSYSEKISAIQLIVYIKLNFTKIIYNYEELYENLEGNKEAILNSKDELFQKNSILTLKINFVMLKLTLEKLNVIELNQFHNAHF